MAEYIEDNFIYIGLGSALFSLAFFLFFKLNKNARLKRVVFPIVHIAVTAGFLFLFWNMSQASFGPAFLILVAFAAAIGISNYRNIAFCDECGATSYSKGIFKRPSECSSCGSKWV